jgi:uncharacterized protein YndB with AHSA1/START domain
MKADHTKIMVSISIETSIADCWKKLTSPEHIVHWNAASPEWHTPHAINDLTVGGNFAYRMEARNGSMGFDFTGVYTEIVPQSLIKYKLEDGRKVEITFEELSASSTRVTEVFDPEIENPVDMQRQGWQAILANFKKYAEQDDKKS